MSKNIEADKTSQKNNNENNVLSSASRIGLTLAIIALILSPLQYSTFPVVYFAVMSLIFGLIGIMPSKKKTKRGLAARAIAVSVIALVTVSISAAYYQAQPISLPNHSERDTPSGK